jgi:hypothetical protein
MFYFLFKKPVLAGLLILACLQTATAQSTEIVEGKISFACMWSPHLESFDNNFSTAEAAVQHYITHMPTGYTLKAGTIEILDNGWVTFITKKTGETDGHQAGKVLGKVLCTDHSYQMEWDPLSTRKCMCDNGYVAKGSKCYEDVCGTQQQLTGDEVNTRNEVLKRLREKVNQVNQEFAAKGIPTDKKSIEKIFITKDAYQKAILDSRNPKLWPALYGKVIEGMTAMAVENDTYLNDLLKYIPWDEQIKPGGGPDFKGKGELPERVEFDVTTNDNADSKMNNPAKQCYQFATYSRLIDNYNTPIKKLKPF